MFGRFFLFSVLLGSLLGCAEPKYVRASDDHGGNQNGEQNAAICSYKWKSSGFCLSWAWETKPTATEVGSLIFKTYRANTFDGSRVSVDVSATPSLILWMPSMGHGSSPTQVERLDVGTYRASQVFFVMPGAWELKFQVKDGSQVLDEAVVDLTF